MIKLTDASYRLPQIEALSAFDLFNHGTTEPLAVWGVDSQTGERGQYVVKFKNYGRMSATSLAFELIGAWMAKELELPVIEPVLVNITSEFVESALKGNNGYKAAFQSQGINFGSKYVSGYSSIPNAPVSIPHKLKQTAALIYVFDLFIANTDRGHQRPNVVSNGSNLLIYDHELAFSFSLTLPFFQNKTPWIFSEAERNLYEDHIFYKLLKEEKPDLTEHVNKLECFDAVFWSKVHQHLPQEWRTDQVLQIEPYLSGIVENLPYFAKSLNQTLAV